MGNTFWWLSSGPPSARSSDSTLVSIDAAVGVDIGGAALEGAEEAAQAGLAGECRQHRHEQRVGLVRVQRQQEL
eukprot:scaffold35662_cov66-Phaeocystis_antarctica.AAC.1